MVGHPDRIGGADRVEQAQPGQREQAAQRHLHRRPGREPARRPRSRSSNAADGPRPGPSAAERQAALDELGPLGSPDRRRRPPSSRSSGGSSGRHGAPEPGSTVVCPLDGQRGEQRRPPARRLGRLRPPGTDRVGQHVERGGRPRGDARRVGGRPHQPNRGRRVELHHAADEGRPARRAARVGSRGPGDHGQRPRAGPTAVLGCPPIDGPAVSTGKGPGRPTVRPADQRRSWTASGATGPGRGATRTDHGHHDQDRPPSPGRPVRPDHAAARVFIIRRRHHRRGRRGAGLVIGFAGPITGRRRAASGSSSTRPGGRIQARRHARAPGHARPAGAVCRDDPTTSCSTLRGPDHATATQTVQSIKCLQRDANMPPTGVLNPAA